MSLINELLLLQLDELRNNSPNHESFDEKKSGAFSLKEMCILI